MCNVQLYSQDIDKRNKRRKVAILFAEQTLRDYVGEMNE